MHEARIAASVADALRRSGQDRGDTPILVRVHGGQHDPAAFDAALRQHLTAQLPTLASARLRIHHEPVEALCSACLRAFHAAAPGAGCPDCGAEGVTVPSPERIELEWVAPCA